MFDAAKLVNAANGSKRILLELEFLMLFDVRASAARKSQQTSILTFCLLVFSKKADVLQPQLLRLSFKAPPARWSNLVTDFVVVDRKDHGVVYSKCLL